MELRPRVLYPELARRRWMYRNMDDLVVADELDPNLPNPWVEPAYMADRLCEQMRLDGVDGGYYGGTMELRTNVWRDTYMTKEADGTRMRHLGFDLWAKAETQILAPCGFEVIHTVTDPANGGWGGALFCKMDEPFNGFPYLIIAHLTPSWLAKVGERFAAGEPVGRLGNPYENGGWAPHGHFQLYDEIYQQRFWPRPELMDGYGPNDEESNPHIGDATMLVMEKVAA